MQNAKLFKNSGGGDLRYIPALNARDEHVSFLSRTIERSVSGWPESNPDWSHSEASRQLEKSLQRAKGAGCNMLGRFLEFGIHTPDIIDSLGFYKLLGFHELEVGDVWNRTSTPWSATERLCIGLHDLPVEEGPAITFVHEDLAKEALSMSDHGFDFDIPCNSTKTNLTNSRIALP